MAVLVVATVELVALMKLEVEVVHFAECAQSREVVEEHSIVVVEVLVGRSYVLEVVGVEVETLLLIFLQV